MTIPLIDVARCIVFRNNQERKGIMRKKIYTVFAVMIALLALFMTQPKPVEAENGMMGNIVPVNHNIRNAPLVMWLNHLDLLAGDSSVKTSFTALSSMTGGLSGLNIQSTTLGDTGIPAGNKVVEMGVPTIPGYTIIGVRVCYELSDPRSFITQIRLAQLQNPPSSALVMLDDATDLVNKGPICVTSAPTAIDPQKGAVRLSLRLNFGNTSDVIVVRGIGLLLKPKS
jgi:hypothetical protein